MASLALLIGVKGDERTLESSGLYSAIRGEFRVAKAGKNSKGFDLLELWDKGNGVVMKHDFGKIHRKQININGGINPIRQDEPSSVGEDPETEPETDTDGMSKDEIKAELDKLEVEYDGRMGAEKLRELLDQELAK